MSHYQVDSKRWKKNSQKMTQKTIKIFLDEIYSKPPKGINLQTKLMFIILLKFLV